MWDLFGHEGMWGTGGFAVMCLVLAVGLGLRLAVRRLPRARDRRHTLAMTALDSALVGAIALVVAMTLLPRHGGPSMLGQEFGSTQVNLVPFATIERFLRWGTPTQQFNNLVLNMALFVPFGWAMALKARERFPLVVALLTGALLSASVEAGQYLLPIHRSADVDDVLLNVVGTLVGALGALAVLPVLRWLARGRRHGPITA